MFDGRRLELVGESREGIEDGGGDGIGGARRN